MRGGDKTAKKAAKRKPSKTRYAALVRSAQRPKRRKTERKTSKSRTRKSLGRK